MSLDRKLRKRSDIRSDISQRESDKQKRLSDTKTVVQDKKTEATTAKALRLSGTEEGKCDVKKAMESAAKATDTEFQKQERDMERKVFQTAKDVEANLKKRSSDTSQDMQRMGQAVGQIDTKAAKDLVSKAREGARQERDFLDKSRDQQEKDRKAGETKIRDQQSQLKNARITFKR